MKKVGNVLFDTKIDIQLRLFYILAWTACIANTIGFISNLIFYGVTNATIFCGVCALFMYVFGIVGSVKKETDFSAAILLFIINVIEFPVLYYLYGPGRSPYMILGIVGILVFLKKDLRFLLTVFVVIFDTVVIIFSAMCPSNIINVTQKDDCGATVVTFLVVAISVALIIVLLIKQYEIQNDELIIMTQQLKDMANLDPLTKLYNRRYLTNYLDDVMKVNDADFAVVLLDLDDFKSINDNYGHVYGDEVLYQFAYIMKKHIEKLGIAARFGGEEFMLVFNKTNKDEIKAVLENIKRDIADFSHETKEICITFSAGVEIYHNKDRITRIFNVVDEKLYFAKKNGKNRVVFEI